MADAANLLFFPLKRRRFNVVVVYKIISIKAFLNCSTKINKIQEKGGQLDIM